MPADAPDAVQEGGRPATEADGVRYAGIEDGRPVFVVGSGRYRFEVAR